MSCPVCREPLFARLLGLFDDIPVHECARCGGTFYPAGSLDRLDDNVWVNAETLDYAPMPEAARLGCPLCVDTALYRGRAGTDLTPLSHPRRLALLLARCPRCCGFWLERGMLDELRQLVAEVAVG